MVLTAKLLCLSPSHSRSGRILGRISTTPDVPEDDHSSTLLRCPAGSASAPPGFLAYLLEGSAPPPGPQPSFVLPRELDHLADGDIVRIDLRTSILTTLFQRSARSNSLVVTERCDNQCIMCSQPPVDSNDTWLLDDAENTVALMRPGIQEIGITGGEPALLGQRLVDLILRLKLTLPDTAVHLLSNGRRFSDPAFASCLAAVRHPDLMVGIPLHSDLPEEHDYIAQRRGAFDETVRGILNLKRLGVRVEIRFVIHAENRACLRSFADFVSRNLVFVDHVALMAMEPVGFARANLDRLLTSPTDYVEGLAQAVRDLARAGSCVSIYNLPLCALPAELHPFARRSISEWKNAFPQGCSPCRRRDDCCGFFTSDRGASALVPFRLF
jgi:His-Xaa-Ser system radical SAM maturase HxsC